MNPDTDKKARTQRALVRGTAKRLSTEHAKPRPMRRVFDWSVDSGESSRFSDEPVAKATQILVSYSSIIFG